MVFVGFYSYDVITFRIADIIYLLFNIVSNRTFKHLLTVFADCSARLKSAGSQCLKRHMRMHSY